MIDETDYKILTILRENSKLQWKEIGEMVHLTGQAVANRIKKLESEGIIEGYTIRLNEKNLDIKLLAFITVFMKKTDHASFHKFIEKTELVTEGHRISGEGCYILRAQFKDQEELNKLLDGILEYGNYRVNLSIDKIK